VERDANVLICKSNCFDVDIIGRAEFSSQTSTEWRGLRKPNQNLTMGETCGSEYDKTK